jgi:sec-independent protein translocase protein TatA
MRIIKSEVKEMKNDGKTESTDPSGPVEGKVVNHPQAKPGEPTDGTDVPPSNRA